MQYRLSGEYYAYGYWYPVNLSFNAKDDAMACIKARHLLSRAAPSSMLKTRNLNLIRYEIVSFPDG